MRDAPNLDMPHEETPKTAMVAAFFPTSVAADEAIADLLTSGFDPHAVQILTHVIRDAIQEPTGNSVAAEDRSVPLRAGTIIPGVTMPAGIISPGGLLSESAGSISPTVGPGPGGLLADGLAALHLSDERASYLTGEMGRGRILVTVQAGPRAAVARTILARNGGEIADVSTSAES